MRAPIRLTFVLLGAFCFGCAERPSLITSESEGPIPVVIAAVDGLEWNELIPLLREEQLPTLAELARTGQFGRLRSMVPTVSPIIWTTVATGKGPDGHGIRGFAKTSVPGGPPTVLFNSQDRRTKAFWNILSDYDRRVAVIGWWMTYPVDEIDGLMVAQVNTLDRVGGERKGPLVGGLQAGVPEQVYPPDREDEVFAIHERVIAELPERTQAIFGKEVTQSSPRERRRWDETQWAFRADATYLEIAHAFDPNSFDVLAIYLGGTDVVSHRYWRHAHPEEFANPPDAESLARFGDVIRDYYRAVDAELGRLLARYPTPPTVIVLSDHGMHAANTDLEFAGDQPAISGNHEDGPSGMVLLAGPRIRPAGSTISFDGLRRDGVPVLGAVTDITPTLLALLRIPIGRDMLGRVWWDAIAVEPSEMTTVPTHDDAQWQRSLNERRPEEVSVLGEDARFEQLRSLGYLR